MKTIIYPLVALLSVAVSAPAQDLDPSNAAAGFRESFLETAFPLTKAMLAMPSGSPVGQLDFSFPHSERMDSPVIDHSPPNYFNTLPYAGATTIHG